MMKKMQQGFTLIELMIVIAIIGILAAIAIPQYNDYVMRSQITGSLAEVSGGRTAYEERYQRGGDASLEEAGDIGLQASTQRCSSIDVSDARSADNSDQLHIQCTIEGNPTIEDDYIGLQRSTSGEYLCWYLDGGSSAGNGESMDGDLLPQGCSDGTSGGPSNI